MCACVCVRPSREREGVISGERGALSHEKRSVLSLVVLQEPLRIESTVAQFPVKPPDSESGAYRVNRLFRRKGVKSVIEPCGINYKLKEKIHFRGWLDLKKHSLFFQVHFCARNL